MEPEGSSACSKEPLLDPVQINPNHKLNILISIDSF
jgi:hypothetical protein